MNLLPTRAAAAGGWRHALAALAPRASIAMLAVALPLAAVAGSYNFTVIDVPGYVDTKAVGINNAGQIVGWGDNGGCCADAFVTAGLAAPPVVFTVPGAVNISEAWGINAQGDIAGIYYDGAKLWGYVKSGNGIALVDPGAPNDIYAHGIDSAGQVVGTYSLDGGVTTHSYIKTGASYTSFDIGNGGWTVANGINDVGAVVGSFMDNGTGHGFIKRGATVTVYDVPGAQDTSITGTNNLADLVGNWYGANGDSAAFILHGPTLTSFNVPGSTYTQAWAVNDLGQIVGEFGDAQNIVHGFLATPVPEPGSLALLAAGLAAVAALRRRRTLAAAGLALACAGPALAFNPQPDPPARLGVVSLSPLQTLRISVRAVQPSRSDAAPAPCRVSIAFTDAEARAIGPSQIVLLRPGQARAADLHAADVGASEPGTRLLVHPVLRLLPAVQDGALPACAGVAVTVELFEPNDRSVALHAEPWLLTPDSGAQ